MRRKHFLITTAITAGLITGCATTEFQTSTAPISAATANQIIEGKDTKTDVIAMFGAPNGLATQNYTGGIGYYPGAANYNSGQDSGDLLSYRDCTVKSAAEVDAGKTAIAATASVFTFGLSNFALGGGAKNSTVEECKMLAVLLDDKDIVRARGYVDSNLFTEERVKQIVENTSTKADVVRVMTVPSSITSSGDDEILTYKNCLSSGSSGFTAIKNTSKQTNVCQQASFIIDKASGQVERVTHIPFPVSKK